MVALPEGSSVGGVGTDQEALDGNAVCLQLSELAVVCPVLVVLLALGEWVLGLLFGLVLVWPFGVLLLVLLDLL